MDRDRFPPSALPWFLILACLLHLWGWRVPLSKLDPTAFLKSRLKKSGEDAIVIERLPDPKQPIVQTSRAKEDPALKDKPARFSGEFSNRVEKETKSPLTGEFREGRAKSGTLGGDDVPLSPDLPGSTAENDAKDGDAVAAGKRGGKGPKGLGMSDLLAFGRTPNQLPSDIADGSETVLNTDPVKYAGFINRIAEVIYDPWVRHAREAVNHIYVNGRKLDETTYVTKLSVVMNTKGGIDAIQTLQSSGVDELDEAPKKAFWSVEPFQNPPPQMFKNEESVKFVYEFHFEWKSSGFSIVPFRI